MTNCMTNCMRGSNKEVNKLLEAPEEQIKVSVRTVFARNASITFQTLQVVFLNKRSPELKGPIVELQELLLKGVGDGLKKSAPDMRRYRSRSTGNNT